MTYGATANNGTLKALVTKTAELGAGDSIGAVLNVRKNCSPTVLRNFQAQGVTVQHGDELRHDSIFVLSYGLSSS
jgi:hypothetical protein